MIFLVAFEVLLAVTMVDGRSVMINPAQVTHMSEARRDVDTDKQLAPGVHCVIFFSDGSYVSAAEECLVITNRWMELRQ